MTRSKYPVRKFILSLVGALSVLFFIATRVLLALGFGYQGALSVTVTLFPCLLFIGLYGFYKGLVRHYDLKGEEKLFFGGKF